MSKEGFGGTWIEICKIGEHKDSTNAKRLIDEKFLNQVVANFKANEAAATIGHPETDTAPAYGWVTGLRINGDRLEAKFSDTDDQFETYVKERKFPNRSAAFYVEPPRLHHVAFLGAQPPAVKGLRPINFAAGETFTIEEEEITQFEEHEMDEKTMSQVTDKVAEGAISQILQKLGFGKKPETASLSEPDIKGMIETALKPVQEDFNAKLKEKDDELVQLRESMNQNSDSAQRAEIIAFVESIPAEKGKFVFQNIHLAEFLEACAKADAADKTPAIVCFTEGDGGAKVEHKFTRVDWMKKFIGLIPPMVQFGEQFGDLKATAEADVVLDNGRLDGMRSEMGIKPEEGGKK